MKLCTIIGMGPGMGLAIARRFGKGGYNIAMLARKAETLESAGVALAAAGISAHGYLADAGDPAKLTTVLDAVHAQHGNSNVLVYNAAILKPGKLAGLTTERLREEFRVNVAGAVTAVQAVLKPMKNEGGGSILFTGGGFGLEPNPEWLSLSIGKAGLRNLAFSLNQELNTQGIHVGMVTICGYVGSNAHFSADNIAEAYWQLHADPKGSFRPEIQYR